MTFENNYSLVDRAIHKIAFHSYSNIQTVLSELEDSLYEKKISSIRIRKPVFITALPRAGTTLLLEMVMSAGGFATHSYRNMPFVLTPLLWQRFSSGFQKNDVERERAHGDGMLVSADSYEAFEEILWKIFYKEHYTANSITTWGDDKNSDFVDFFTNHIRKLILLKTNDQNDNLRYVSKNNLNISRINSLLRIFPDAVILVPFRNPLQHAASLLRQHNNFNSMHEQDAFARQYMAAIGHFDFGKNLKPVDFSGWLESARYADPLQLGFWLEYWIAAYSYLLDNYKDRIRFMSYEAMCENPITGLNKLSDVLMLNDSSMFENNASRLKQGMCHTVDTANIDQSLLDKAVVLSEKLQSQSIL